jgi:MFS transporter, ACS family, glucarate transporter
MTTPAPLANSPRPTGVRHFVVFLATSVAVLLYLDRICLSIVERYVKDDLGLSNFQIGLLLSAFFWTYAVGQVPAGWLSDRFGARLTLALYVILWSTFTGLMGLAAGLVFLLLLRLGCGITEAGAYPASASLLSRWVPAARRGLASGIVSIGGRAGGAVAPVLTAYLVIAFVPINSSSQLTPADIPDPKALCQLIMKPDKKTSVSLARAVRERLPADAAALVREVASEPETNDRPLDDQQTTLLLVGLNHVLLDSSLRDDIDRTEMALPDEKDRSLGRHSTEVDRDNRLMLEAGFPTAIAAVYRKAWRPVMMIYGGVGIVVGCVFWLFFRDRPREHPACNAGEIALIEGTGSVPASGGGAWLPPDKSTTMPSPSLIREPPRLDSAGPAAEIGLIEGAGVVPGPHDATVSVSRAGTEQETTKSMGMPLRSLVRDWNLSLISLASFGTNFGWVFLLTWFPRYLLEVHKVSVSLRSWMTGIPLLFGIAGLYLGGWLTDFITQRAGAYRGRCVLLSASRLLAMGAFLSCLWLKSPWLVTAAMVLVSFGTDLGTPGFWAYSQDVGGRHVGSVLGWLNMWGNIGAAISPLLFGLMVDRGQWKLMFLCCAAAFLIAAVAILGVDASRPIDFSEPKH